jgi:hypothetical protein
MTILRMADSNAVVSSLVRSAVAAMSQSASDSQACTDDDFTTIVSQTRNAFHKRQRVTDTTEAGDV